MLLAALISIPPPQPRLVASGIVHKSAKTLPTTPPGDEKEVITATGNVYIPPFLK